MLAGHALGWARVGRNFDRARAAAATVRVLRRRDRTAVRALRFRQQRRPLAVQVVDEALRDGELQGEAAQVLFGMVERALDLADLEEVAALRDGQQEAAAEEGAVEAALAPRAFIGRVDL